jgi:hypothetical protein
MQLEVVALLSSGNEDSVQEFLDLGVACLGVRQDFADEVKRTLDLEGVPLLLLFHHDGGTHHLGGGRTRIEALVRSALSLSSAS